MNKLGIEFMESVYKAYRGKLDYKRLHHPIYYPAAEGDPAYPVISYGWLDIATNTITSFVNPEFQK